MQPSQQNNFGVDIAISDPSAAALALSQRSRVRYTIRVWDDPDTLANEIVIDNITTLQGLENIQLCYLAGAGGPGPSGTWWQPLFVGLINATGFTALNYVDTAQKITTSAPSYPTTNNWEELTTYTGGVRQPMGALAITSGTNNTVAAGMIL